MSGLLTGVLALALLVPPAVLVPAALRIRGGLEVAIAAVMVAAAELVLVAIALTPLTALHSGGILVGETLVAALAAGGWWASGRPTPARPMWRGAAPLGRAARAHPAAAVLATLAALALLVELVLGVAVPPNNWDSMTYHLARAGFWLQQDGLQHFDNGTIRQLANPVNAEVLQAWTLEVFGTDRLANLVQWTSLVALAGVIFSGTRLLGFSPPAALFAASAFTLLPQPVMQATSTQNDLVVSLFIAATLVFAARGLRDRSRGDLAIAALALGLALGTKGTALFALPSIALVLGLAAATYRPPRATLAWGAGLALAGAAALGSFNYALNLDTYDDPLGGLAEHSGKRVTSVHGNLLRVGWSFVETPGIDAAWLSLAVERPARAILRDQSTQFFTSYSPDTGVQEDTIAYGLAGFLVLPPLLLAALVLPRSRPSLRVLAGAALLYLLVLAILKEQDPWIGRLLMPMVVLAAPLFALLYRWPWLRIVTTVLLIASAAPVLLTNPQKPLLVPEGGQTTFALDRLQQQTAIRPEMYQVLTALHATVDADSPIGLVRSGDSWDYSFFGRRLERRVVPLEPEEVTPERLREDGLVGAVYANVDQPLFPSRELAPGYWYVAAGDVGAGG